MRRGGGSLSASTGAGDVLCALGIGQKADVTDAVESVRQDMQQEPPHELGGQKGHDTISILFGLALILDTERTRWPSNAVMRWLEMAMR